MSQKFSKEQLPVLKAWLMCKEQDSSNNRQNTMLKARVVLSMQ
jgi:hypothetical protein